VRACVHASERTCGCYWCIICLSLYSPGSVIVTYEVETISDGVDPYAITAALQEHSGTFAGHDMDQDSVAVSGG